MTATAPSTSAVRQRFLTACGLKRAASLCFTAQIARPAGFSRSVGALAAVALFAASSPAPGQEPPWRASTVVMETQELGDGVYGLIPADADEKAPKGLPIATTSGVIVGSRGAMIVDLGVNRHITDQILAAARAATDGPILYAVATSFHGDHFYGAALMPEETDLIVHHVTNEYTATKFDQDVAFMKAVFGEGEGIEDARRRAGDLLIPSGGRLTVDLGDRPVEIIDFGFTQTGGDLFVWEPSAKVLWAGNSLIAERPSLPWLLDGGAVASRDSLQRVLDFLPPDARIVPGHGRVVDRAEIAWTVAYLTELVRQVDAALDQGLNLEETVASLEMAEFRGYALFGWVHDQVNVPRTYAELLEKR